MAKKLKFCANLTTMFQECGNLLERFDAAKSAGFAAVEMQFPYDIPLKDLVAKKESTGMEQVLINAYGGLLFHFLITHYPKFPNIKFLIVSKSNEIILYTHTLTGSLKNGDLGLAAIPDRVKEFQDSVPISMEYADGLNCKLYMHAFMLRVAKFRRNIFLS